MGISRRRFIQSATAITASTRWAGAVADQTLQIGEDRLGRRLPTRALGRNSERISMLGVGGAHLGRLDRKVAEHCVELAMEHGVRFWDTAVIYSRGQSESYFGEFLTPKYRDLAFIMTKSTARDAATARKELDASRKRMKLDIIDLWQIHGLEDEDDVDARVKNGVLDVFLEAKRKQTVRYIGFTGHRTTAALLHMLQHLQERQVELDTCQMPVNIVDQGYESFIDRVLPQLVERGYAPLAMKTLAYGQLFGNRTSWISDRGFSPGQVPRVIPDTVTAADALHFVWSLPVTSAIMGFDNAEQLVENIQVARGFVQLEERRRAAIQSAAAPFAGADMEFYKIAAKGRERP